MSKPFNLQEALLGKPVETECNFEVNQLVKLSANEPCLVGVVVGQAGTGVLRTWFSNTGKSVEFEPQFNLRMVTVKKVYFYNCWQRENTWRWTNPPEIRPYHFFTGPFVSMEQAINDSKIQGPYNLLGIPKNPKRFIRIVEIVVEE